MKRFIEENDRTQGYLLPESIEEYVSSDNPVRVIDAFVEELDLGQLGFAVLPEATGRPGYHPSSLLKIYIYGYLNRIQSSRRLEREAQRNLELMWLTGRLMPDFKTIANFRKDNGDAIRGVCREFIALCRRLDLFSQAIVAIDGSKFKAVNNRDRNFTVNKMKRRLEQIEESVARYLAQLDSADRQETAGAKVKAGRLEEKIKKLRQEVRRLRKLETRMLQSPDQQISLTDPDARSMATRQATGEVDLTVVADRGYFSGAEILECTNAGMTPYVPRPLHSTARADGRFGKPDFVYIARKDEYRCPAGRRLTRRFTNIEDGMTIHTYWYSDCASCSIKSQCTTSDARRVRRWEHEGVLDRMQERLDLDPGKMRIRRQTAEHPFGTLKAWMGATHFLTKTLPKVKTEMSLHVLAYNMKRVMNILTPEGLIDCMQL